MKRLLVLFYCTLILSAGISAQTIPFVPRANNEGAIGTNPLHFGFGFFRGLHADTLHWTIMNPAITASSLGAVTGTPWTSMGYVTGTPWTGMGYVTGTPWASMGYLTSYTETDPNVSAWAKASTKPTYTYTEVGAASTSDSRLSDARTPTAHNQTKSTITDFAHTHPESEVTNLVNDLGNKQATLVSGTNIKTVNGNSLLGSGDIAIGGSATWGSVTGTLSSQTDLQNALNAKADAAVNTSYRSLLEVSGSHIAAKTAGTYAIGYGVPIAVSGTGTLSPIALIHIIAADYPTVNGVTSKLRIRATVAVNAVAPTGNYTIGLYPVTSGAGAAGLKIYTMGTLVSGSATTTVTAPVASSMTNVVGSDFVLPADGVYCLAVVTTATVATSSLVHVFAKLQMRNN